MDPCELRPQCGLATRARNRDDAMMLAMNAFASVGEPVLRTSSATTRWQPALSIVGPPVTDARRPLTVMLVDDNHQHRIPLVRALRAQNHNVLYAASGARGEDLFQTSRLEIDALVACVEMKSMNGFELARRLRRVRPGIGVLLMCRRFANLEEADRARARGYPLIEEPFTPEQLCRRLMDVLSTAPEKPRELQA